MRLYPEHLVEQVARATDAFAMLLMTYLESLAPADRGGLITLREQDHAYHQFVQFLRAKLLADFGYAAQLGRLVR